MRTNIIDQTLSHRIYLMAAAILLAALAFGLGFMKPSLFIAGLRVTPTDFLFPFLFLSVISAIFAGSLQPRWSNAYIWFALYAAVMFVSCLNSGNPAQSFFKLLGELYLIGLAVIVINTVRDLPALRVVLLAWIGGAVVAIAIGLAAIVLFYVSPQNSLLAPFVYHYGAVPLGNYPRVSSTFVSASMFCNYLNVTFFILVAAREQLWISGRFFKISIAGVLICAAFTISAGLGAFIASIAVYLAGLFMRRNRFIAIIILATGICGAIFLTALAFIELTPRSGGSVASGNLTPSPRVEIWKQSLDTIAEFPFTGKGLGLPVVGVRYVNADGSVSFLTDAHNVFLNIGAQTGILGILAVIAVCIFVALPMFHGRMHRDSQQIQTLMIVAFFAAFIGQGLTGSFEDARHLWFLVGLIIAVRELNA